MLSLSNLTIEKQGMIAKTIVVNGYENMSWRQQLEIIPTITEYIKLKNLKSFGE